VLLLLAVPVDLSSHHGCVDGAEKAHEELQFVWRRPQTAEIRCSRDALCRTGRHDCGWRAESTPVSLLLAAGVCGLWQLIERITDDKAQL
jgi:hypothetical protein